MAAPPVREKIWIANVATGARIEAQYNPKKFEPEIEVEYAELKVPGLSHRPLQYVSTGNVKSPIELLFVVHSVKERQALEYARRFLMSLCVPWRGQAAPPRALFVWPNEASLQVVIRGTLKFSDERFNRDMGTIEMSAKVPFEEIRDTRLVGEDVLASGLWRSGLDGRSWSR